jgi:hypothetical protein
MEPGNPTSLDRSTQLFGVESLMSLFRVTVDDAVSCFRFL